MNATTEFQIGIAAKNAIGCKEKGRRGDSPRQLALPQASFQLPPASLRIFAFFAANFSFLVPTTMLVALHNLAADLAEKNNVIANPAQADRVTRMEKLYREIRAAKRSTGAQF